MSTAYLHFLLLYFALNHSNVITLCFQVIKGLLKFWPKTCSQKEVCKICLFSKTYKSSLVYLALPWGPTDIGFQLGKAFCPCNR